MNNTSLEPSARHRIDAQPGPMTGPPSSEGSKAMQSQIDSKPSGGSKQDSFQRMWPNKEANWQHESSDSQNNEHTCSFKKVRARAPFGCLFGAPSGARARADPNPQKSSATFPFLMQVQPSTARQMPEALLTLR